MEYVPASKTIYDAANVIEGEEELGKVINEGFGPPVTVN